MAGEELICVAPDAFVRVAHCAVICERAVKSVETLSPTHTRGASLSGADEGVRPYVGLFGYRQDDYAIDFVGFGGGEFQDYAVGVLREVCFCTVDQRLSG